MSKKPFPWFRVVSILFTLLLCLHLGFWYYFFWNFTHKIDPNYLEYFWFCVIFVALLFSLSLISKRSLILFLFLFYPVASYCIIWYWREIYSVAMTDFASFDTIWVNQYFSMDHNWHRRQLFFENFRVGNYINYKNGNMLPYNVRMDCIDKLADEIIAGRITTKSEVRLFMFNYYNKPPYHDLGKFENFDNLFKFDPTYTLEYSRRRKYF